MFEIKLSFSPLLRGPLHDLHAEHSLRYHLPVRPGGVLLFLWRSASVGEFTLCLRLDHRLLQIFAQIKAAHHPMTNLLTNKQLTPLAAIYTRRILDFINSEHSGFRCADLFLIRKQNTMEVRFCFKRGLTLESSRIRRSFKWFPTSPTSGPVQHCELRNPPIRDDVLHLQLTEQRWRSAVD